MSSNLNVLDLADPKIRTLHLTWFAFFLSFLVWFNHAPLQPLIMATFDLTLEQWKTLLTLNVALTIPARIVIGMLVDRFGPRHVFATLLMLGGVLCTGFALAQTYQQLALARFLLGFVGAGFVIGIRMIGEWFPARSVGLAQGIYGGWGNFGSAAAAFTMPLLALSVFDGEQGWRYAVLTTGAIAFCYGIVFYLRARNTPAGATYFKPKRSGGLEVSSRRDYWFYIAMNIPMYLVLSLLVWQLSPARAGLIGDVAACAFYGLFAALFCVQYRQIHKVNREMLRHGAPPSDQYRFKQVAVLSWAYFVTFGSELAVVSMLPGFFLMTFDGLSLTAAGALGGSFVFMALIARPAGGWLSDRFGRRRTLTLIVAGLSLGYLAMSRIDASWPLALAVLVVVFCSLFVQAGAGAVFAIVPLIKRRMTGQIAGMAGAFGNVGAVTYLTAYTFVDAGIFFVLIALSAIVVAAMVQWLDEPSGHISEVLPDGTVHLIRVS